MISSFVYASKRYNLFTKFSSKFSVSLSFSSLKTFAYSALDGAASFGNSRWYKLLSTSLLFFKQNFKASLTKSPYPTFKKTLSSTSEK